MEQELILSRLLDKYENSKHVSQPNTSKRRVMLCINKKDLPEYEYEKVDVRDRFNSAVRILEREGLVEVKFLNDRPIISIIILNMQQIEKVYKATNRIHPIQAVQDFFTLVENILSAVKTPWISSWKDHTCQTVKQTLRLPSFCKKGKTYTREFLQAFVYYDKLDGATISVRAFSAACFQNSKRFELEFQDDFLKAAMGFHQELAEVSEQSEFGVREKLSLLGIYSHPELYQMSGCFTVEMPSGIVDFSPLFPHGIAISGSSVDGIISFGLKAIRKVIFIENLTNYNEYLRTEINPDELVIYHGGFTSPKKRQLLQKLSEFVSSEIEVFFWADIDLGGFQMFGRLQKIFSKLSPMRMSAEDVTLHASSGLAREASYLNRIQTALNQNEFPLFKDSMQMILQYGVTIEQEVFLAVDNKLNFRGGEGNCPTALSILLRASGPPTRSPAHPCAGFYS